MDRIQKSVFLVEDWTFQTYLYTIIHYIIFVTFVFNIPTINLITMLILVLQALKPRFLFSVIIKQKSFDNVSQHKSKTGIKLDKKRQFAKMCEHNHVNKLDEDLETNWRPLNFVPISIYAMFFQFDKSFF